MHGPRTIDRWTGAELLRDPGKSTTRQASLIPSPDTGHVSVDHPLGAFDLHDDRGIKWIAFGVAVALHLIVMAVKLPEFKHVVQTPRRGTVLVVKKYVPPPPQIKRTKVVARKKLVRRVPIPDPTPQEPEPIREPEPDIVYEPLPPDVDVVIGVPEPPPMPEQPLLAGVGGVSNPVLIPETKVHPEYPELARIARIEANVILQAVIRSDGTVGEIHVLRCNHEMLGFEQAAMDAVSQWRYIPGEQNGRPVDVYLTVFVEFQLL